MPGDPFYGSAEWRRVRTEFLAAHPSCYCGRRATHVDHVVPRRRGGAPYAWGNLQGLCHGCHNRKTNVRDGGFGRPASRSLLRPGCDAEGRPIDPEHPWNAGRPRPIPRK